MDFYNEFDFQMALFDYENEEMIREQANAPDEAESTGGTGRAPVSPLPSITPAPIIPPGPSPLPSGGTINPTPQPSPPPSPPPIVCTECNRPRG